MFSNVPCFKPLLRPHTNTTQQRGDGVPDPDAALPEPLSYSQLQVEQGEALKHQCYQVRDEERSWQQQKRLARR